MDISITIYWKGSGTEPETQVELKELIQSVIEAQAPKALIVPMSYVGDGKFSDFNNIFSIGRLENGQEFKISSSILKTINANKRFANWLEKFDLLIVKRD